MLKRDIEAYRACCSFEVSKNKRCTHAAYSEYVDVTSDRYRSISETSQISFSSHAGRSLQPS